MGWLPQAKILVTCQASQQRTYPVGCSVDGLSIARTTPPRHHHVIVTKLRTVEELSSLVGTREGDGLLKSTRGQIPHLKGTARYPGCGENLARLERRPAR